MKAASQDRAGAKCPLAADTEAFALNSCLDLVGCFIDIEANLAVDYLVTHIQHSHVRTRHRALALA